MQAPPSPLPNLALHVWPGLTPYDEALRRQEVLVSALIAGTDSEALVFCGHPPVFTAGTSANLQEEIIDAAGIPVIESSRGGKVTYHGPGQRVIYPILDLNRRGRDLRAHVQGLQAWIGAALNELGIKTIPGEEVGVWVQGPDGIAKIAAIGVRVRKWVTFHGVALNVAPDLSVYRRIVPCGIRDKGTTSLAQIGFTGTQEEVDRVLLRLFPAYFAVHEQSYQSGRQGADSGA